MTRTHRWLRGGISFAIAAATGVAVALACGPFLTDLMTVRGTVPAHADEYAAGNLGVVQPHYARIYLVQAYRVLSGKAPMGDTVIALTDPCNPSRGTPCPSDPFSTAKLWVDAASRVVGNLGDADQPTVYKATRPGAFEMFDNCSGDAFLTAVRTLEARMKQYGATSARVSSWTRAQLAVFRNCGEKNLVLPSAVAANADAAARADHAYQVAAAHFYAMDFDEAAERFRAIARDPASPWRGYGRYLAARALIRKATLAEEPSPETAAAFRAADAELQQALKDTAATALHASARGLRDFIAIRERPMERLHEMSKLLASDPGPAAQALNDYRVLMDRLLEEGATTVEFDYPAIANRDALTRDDDLTDWVLVMQARGSSGLDRALERWRATRSLPWLVAVLWQIPFEHAETNAALEQAQAVTPSSPAFATLGFLRARLLANGGRPADARALLGTLPTATGPGVTPETLNLLRAERLMLAATFEEFVAHAVRISVGEDPGRAVFDNDAGDVFTYHLPIARLIDAAKSTALPPRLRSRIAGAALARAIVLRRAEQGIAAATVLKELAPEARADLDRYISVTDNEARLRAGVLLLARTPGLGVHVQGLEDDYRSDEVAPAREFDHPLARNWWCISREGEIGLDNWYRSRLISLLYPTGKVPPPSFLSAEERHAAVEEVAEIRTSGSGRDFVTSEAIRWARDRRTDLDAAEALALAVEGGRWSCGDWTLSKQAFETLHRLFPKSQAARRTKYWYK